ncbi:hypothetical protein ONS95_014591 [Cadophora gregata]|uniref:uncharacterized protein n=1 Tax=Cadophora gregata TaxID=51156 RepID=UPI0026DAF378|nr:uncharacterized protein ONS95_014591 [Cadophora gregata]KAK0112867.1 hypothetical protein ONS95_014591 [Cadophora gregata]KAK0124995.1 hypothetical protein ONS96_008865 [Cadophora gregata f. sp. sojae]
MCDLSLNQRASAKAALPQIEHLSLSTLPIELRQHIYSYIYTEHTNVPLSRFPYSDYNHTGCRCGEGLSLTNRLFYFETRHLFYDHARFSFKTPVSCKRFLDGIGPHIKDLGALVITLEYNEIHLLRSIFNNFPSESSLHTLYLEYTSQSAWPTPGPIYLPSVQEKDASITYDVRFRPELHPLSKLKSMRKITVIGDIESQEVQEAVVKLSLKIEDAACRDGAMAKKIELVELTYFGKPQIWFSIEHPALNAVSI